LQQIEPLPWLPKARYQHHLLTLVTTLYPRIRLFGGGEDDALDALNFAAFLVFRTPIREALLLSGRENWSSQCGICENLQRNQAPIALKHTEATGSLFRWHDKKAFSGTYSLF
jgi:hypothetical protein